MSRRDGDIDLDAVARRLSFSVASPAQTPSPSSRPRAPHRSPRRRQPALPPIAEDPGEQQQQQQQAAAAEETRAPPRPSPWTTSSSSSSSPSRPTWHAAPASALHPVLYERPAMPVATAGPASAAPSVSSPFQQREAVAAALRELERRREAQLRMQQQAWAAAAAQLLRLYTVEGEPAGYETKWEELHPVSQGLLLQIEGKIREYRHDSEQLDQCSRLNDPSVSNKGFELDSRQITQEIGSISTIMDREKASIQNLMAVVREMMRSADFAIHSYMKLRPRFVHRGAEIANAGFVNCDGSSGTFTDFNQPLAMASTFCCYRGAVRRPSLFLQNMVTRFENQLDECCKLIGELEQLVQMKNDKTYLDTLESLPKVMSNTHDYFIHVAAKVENLYQYAQTMRTQYLNDRQHRGNWNDPFLEADRREAAKQEATARNLQLSSRCKNTW